MKTVTETVTTDTCLSFLSLFKADKIFLKEISATHEGTVLSKATSYLVAP